MCFLGGFQSHELVNAAFSRLGRVSGDVFVFSSFPVCCVGLGFLAHIHTWDESMGFLSAGSFLLWMELSWLLLEWFLLWALVLSVLLSELTGLPKWRPHRCKSLYLATHLWRCSLTQVLPSGSLTQHLAFPEDIVWFH